MAPLTIPRRTPIYVASLLAAAGWLPLALSGCNITIPGVTRVEPTPCALPADATKEEIIQFLNNNTSKVKSWRSNNVTISIGGLPFKPKAYIAVEAPRRFRLKAKSLMGDEADFGSNDERFWFWMRRAKPKHVYTVRHDDFEAIRGRLPIPFRPDWLMQALGVIPLNPAEFTMQPRVADSTIVSLVSNMTTPDGRSVRRVVLVDSCVGRVIRQSLYDSNGRTIASAEFNDYRFDAASGVTMSHEIHLDWPQAKSTMTLRMHNIQVNPGPQSPLMWALPKYDEYTQLDLGRQFGRMASHRPTAQPSGQAETNPGRARLAPSPGEVGRVRIGRGDSAEFHPPVRDDRPAFADEQPSASSDRPTFEDEQSGQSARPTRYAPPIIEGAQTGNTESNQAPPFPG